MSVKAKAFQSFFWASLTNIGIKLINPLATFILAGILTPSDFGLIAIAQLTLAVLQVIQDFGLVQALIRWRDNATQSLAADVTFYLVLIWSGMLYIITWLSAPWIVTFFNEPDARPLIQVMGLILLTSAFGTVPGALLEKRLDFKRKVLPEFLPLLAYIVISILLALSGWGVWSIVWGRVVQSLLTTILMWFASGWRLGFSFNLKIARVLLSYSRPLLMTSFLTILFLYIDNAYVGRLLGVEALGFYTFAFGIANLPVTSITFVVNRISFPSFIELQEQRRELPAAFLYSIRMVTTLIIPIIVAQIILMPDILEFFYGTKWYPSILPIQILSIYALFRSIGGLPTAILMTLGRHYIIPKLIALYLICTAILLWPATYFLGLVGTSLIMSGIISIGAIVWIILANNYLSISLKLFFHTISPQIAASTIMAIYLLLILQQLSPSLVNLIIISFTGGMIYLTGLLVLTRGGIYWEVKDIVSIMRFGQKN